MPLTLRPSQALALLQEIALAQVQDGEADLSARQIAVLLTVYLEAPPHTVRGLAGTLGVGKPVITRALDTMGRSGLIARRHDERDRRNVVVERTAAGHLYVERLAALVAMTVEELTP
jgi:DNA-binding MarR family transcriptional regulator